MCLGFERLSQLGSPYISTLSHFVGCVDQNAFPRRNEHISEDGTCFCLFLTVAHLGFEKLKLQHCNAINIGSIVDSRRLNSQTVVSLP